MQHRSPCPSMSSRPEMMSTFADRTCTAQGGTFLYLSWGRIGNDGSHEMLPAREAACPPSTALRSIARSRNGCRSWLSSP